MDASSSRIDQQIEQRSVSVQALGMPLDAHDDALARLLDRLDSAVLGPGRSRKVGAEHVHGLVVERIDLELWPAQGGPQPAAGGRLHVVGGDAAVRGLAMLEAVADDVREVLVKRSAAGDVEQLHSPADAQDREVPPVGGADEGELDGIHAGLGGAQLGIGLLPVDARLQIRPTRQAHAVDPIE